MVYTYTPENGVSDISDETHTPAAVMGWGLGWRLSASQSLFSWVFPLSRRLFSWPSFSPL